jgi:hypothetical protein
MNYLNVVRTRRERENGKGPKCRKGKVNTCACCNKLTSTNILKMCPNFLSSKNKKKKLPDLYGETVNWKNGGKKSEREKKRLR